MIGRTNRPESEITRRINAIRASADTSFRGMLTAGDFDLKSELRFRNLSGLSFAGDDLRGIDFSGANLAGCDFSGALVTGAIFDGARLGSGLALSCTDLTQAADWEKHVEEWSPSSAARRSWTTDSHIAAWDAFLDTPKLPLMVALPLRFASRGEGRPQRLAVSRRTLTLDDYQWCEPLRALDYNSLVDWREAQTYFNWANAESSHEFRALYIDEWRYIEAVLGDRGENDSDSEDVEHEDSDDDDEFEAWRNRTLSSDHRPNWTGRDGGTETASALLKLFLIPEETFWSCDESASQGLLCFREMPDQEFPLSHAKIRLVRSLR